MSTLRERIEEWGELNGSSGRCPDCHRVMWVESACLAMCDSCGWSEGREDDDDRDRGPDTLENLGMCEADFR